jgi:oligopeptide transport system substrate-binding protein
MRNLLAQRSLNSLTATVAFLLFSACTQLKQPEPAPYFAETAAPPKQELRWSNGKAPKSLDPAKASAAPETDIARALYEGLTDLDPKTLDAIPAAAEKWESSEDRRTWTFHLREDAVWSNGKKLKAQDFVRSWKRLVELGDETAHNELLANIRGLGKKAAGVPDPKLPDFIPSPMPSPANTNSAIAAEPATSPTPSPGTEGVIAESETILRVELIHPDKDLPKLVSHPIFRPVFGGEKEDPKQAMVTNGPFRLSSLNADGIILDKSETYWDRGSVKLERVSFVAAASPEKALEAYRTGKIDAVSNAEFSPAALKLLEPFDDFRRTTYNALNFYEINTAREPFSDRRVRQALSLAIEREKLTEGELQGTSRPADRFFPAGQGAETRLSLDISRAQNLFEEAGFPDGQGFPIVRILINRNDAQQRIARSVAQMWKQHLGVDSEIIVKETSEFDAARASGNYDVVRRGVVLPTADETASLISIFGPRPAQTEPELSASPETRSALGSGNSNTGPATPEPRPADYPAIARPIITENDALYELRAIPLYFPTSYSLVKPYVKGFDANALDSPSLKTVEIDPNWRTR